MIWWLTLAAWLAGWYFGARLALAMRMQRLACTGGLNYLQNCRHFHRPECAKPIGSLRDRTMGDGLAAIGIGATWPVLIIARAIMATTPLTASEASRVVREQQRRIADQATEIERLERQIHGWGQ